MTHVLLIENDAEALATLERGLSEQGFVVSSARDGDSGLELVREQDADFLLVDMSLPKRNGIDILREVRRIKPRLPIFALSSLDDTGSLAVGLDAGADDYITKPVSVGKLAARVKARLRRNDGGASLTCGPLTLDLEAHNVQLDGHQVDLSAREQSLLATFMRNEGMVLSQADLLRTVWHLDFDPGSNVVSVYVGSLRRKIGNHFIETVRGRGYMFQALGPNAGKAD